MEYKKKRVEEFWDDASCGELLFLKGDSKVEKFQNQMESRYRLEPYILPFAEFSKWNNQKVLEIGTGLGADHQMFAQGGAKLTGIDLTRRAISYTRERFKLFNLDSVLKVGDAENLSFDDNTFDLVYSWGVIHHSPNTPKAVNEIYRVLKPRGEARIMIYHKHSILGVLLWFRYALLKGDFSKSLNSIYSEYLESPGTNAFTVAETEELFSSFKKVKISIKLSHADLLSDHVGQRHGGTFLKIMKRIYPRFFVKKVLKKFGLFLLIKAEK